MEKKYFNDIIEEENKDWHHNKNFLVRLFYKWKFKIAIDYAGLKQEYQILDFGCGEGELKKKLEDYSVIGYDINPKQTDILDYTLLEPNVIFAMDVFEHISRTKLREILKNFKKMNPNVHLITAIPTETWLWRKARKVMGLSERVADHITPLKEIIRLLKEEGYEELKKINFFTMSRISLWRIK
jgi:hypothetical protein